MGGTEILVEAIRENPVAEPRQMENCDSMTGRWRNRIYLMSQTAFENSGSRGGIRPCSSQSPVGERRGMAAGSELKRIQNVVMLDDSGTAQENDNAKLWIQGALSKAKTWGI